MVRGCDVAKARVWRERFLRFDDGGMTIAEFCVAEGVSTASFYAWRRKLARPQQATPRKKKPSVFEPLMIAAAATVVIRLPGGASIEVPAASQDALRTIVGQLAGSDVEAARC